MLRPTPPGSNDLPQPEALPLVIGTDDEKAAYAAYKSHNALFDQRVTHHQNDPFLCDITNLDQGIVKQYTFGETNRHVSAFAKDLSKRLPPRRKGDQAIVVGVMGRSGVNYILNDFAIMRLGHIPLHISTTTSSQSISSLLRTTGATRFIYGPEHRQLAESALSPGIDLFPWCSIDRITPEDDDPLWRSELSYDEESNETVAIIHSSGSTGDPKPIPWNNQTWLASNWFAPPGDNFIITPLCHGYARLGAWTALANATRLFIFPTNWPITGENLCKALRAINISTFWVVPALLKAVYDSGGTDLLHSIERVVSCGGPTPTDLGDALVAHGVNLITLVAASEGGSILDSTHVDGLWDHVRPRGLFERYYSFEAQDEGVYELVIRKGYPSLSMFNREDGSWATSDLYTPHPSVRNAWKYYGRKDDLIVHVTGMKTNPLPMEHKLKSLAEVRDAMIVGQGRHRAALLIIPNGELNIAPLLVSINADAAKHSKIIPELVKILSPTATFVISDKGTLKRAKTIAAFQETIDDLYQRIESKRSVRPIAKL